MQQAYEKADQENQQSIENGMSGLSDEDWKKVHSEV